MPYIPHIGRGTPRVLPWLALWAGMLVYVLRGFSFQLIWHLLHQTGWWMPPRRPVSAETVNGFTIAIAIAF